MLRLGAVLGAITLLSVQPRLTERRLGDVARVSVPVSLDGPDSREPRRSSAGRLVWSFSSTYLWASMGSVTRYKQRLVVALMAPDASAAEYDEIPDGMQVSYESRRQLRRETVGAATLTVWECVYAVGADREKAYQYFYVDRARRLQLSWHAVAKEESFASVMERLPRVAASFRVVRDPLATFADLRDAPRADAERQAGNRARTREMLRREGYPVLEPGKPTLRNGAYLEWMSDPEPRYQLLVPLGRVRVPPGTSPINRPRPIRGAEAGLAGTLGWREFDDGEWVFNNTVNAYLPLEGIADALAASQGDRAFVYFYYVATVRVEEQDDDRFLTSLRWFFDGIPEVQRRWRAGALVAPGTPEAP